MKEFCEDFGEDFIGFKVSSGHKQDTKDLWVDKYKPRSLLDLSINKRKVEEVKILARRKNQNQKQQSLQSESGRMKSEWVCICSKFLVNIKVKIEILIMFHLRTIGD